MNEPFEADQLHGEPRSAKPMKGDGPGDQPAKTKEPERCNACGGWGGSIADICGACDGTGVLKTGRTVGQIDVVCDVCSGTREKPVTHTATLPEQGAFEMVVERSRVTISPADSYAYEAWAKVHNRTLRRLTEAHNRDMEAARARIAELELVQDGGDLHAFITLKKRIAALEAEVKQLKADKAEMEAARARIAELENELKRSNTRAASHYRAFCDEQERRSKDDAAFQEYRGRLEAENAQLRADKAELCDALSALILGTPIDKLNRDDDGLLFHRSLRIGGSPRGIDEKIARSILVLKKARGEA